MKISDLHAAYRAGTLTPSDEMERFLAAAAVSEWSAAWITRLEPEFLRDRAADMTRTLRASPDILDRKPLFGVLFAAKDNIDVAGMPTTAACPAYGYMPWRSSTVVARLESAGALCVGKTNMDQFATGLVGTRSPYGAVPNALDPDYISGGSSSGSAVAVARGWVSFSLGTDTAGSGRVPAALNNIVGFKPTRGLLSARGVVPACRSLDCVSVFALTVADAAQVFDVARGYDSEDPFARELPLYPDFVPQKFRFAIPSPNYLEFEGDEHARIAFEKAVRMLESIGGECVTVDFGKFREAAALLYEGPWVAERLSAIRPFFENAPDKMHEVVAKIIGDSRKYSAADYFAKLPRLEELKKSAEAVLDEFDVMVLPTVPTHFERAKVLADPFATNRRLGYYTNFVNLLDMAAISVPTQFREDGHAAGVTLVHRAGSDLALMRLAQRVQRAGNLHLGATQLTVGPDPDVTYEGDALDLVVVGAHLTGQPLNYQLVERGAKLVRGAKTARRYRLYALAGSVPPKPGLVRDGDEKSGHAIEVEIWRMPTRHFGSFVNGISAPLGIGRIEMEDGRWLQGFVCESYALTGAQEISQHGGWRAYRESLKAGEDGGKGGGKMPRTKK